MSDGILHLLLNFLSQPSPHHHARSRSAYASAGDGQGEGMTLLTNWMSCFELHYLDDSFLTSHQMVATQTI